MEIEGHKTEVGSSTAETRPLPFHLIRISPQRDLLLLVSGSSFSIYNLRQDHPFTSSLSL